jgi:hypothetical protein
MLAMRRRVLGILPTLLSFSLSGKWWVPEPIPITGAGKADTKPYPWRHVSVHLRYRGRVLDRRFSVAGMRAQVFLFSIPSTLE